MSFNFIRQCRSSRIHQQPTFRKDFLTLWKQAGVPGLNQRLTFLLSNKDQVWIYDNYFPNNFWDYWFYDFEIWIIWNLGFRCWYRKCKTQTPKTIRNELRGNSVTSFRLRFLDILIFDFGCFFIIILSVMNPVVLSFRSRLPCPASPGLRLEINPSPSLCCPGLPKRVEETIVEGEFHGESWEQPPEVLWCNSVRIIELEFCHQSTLGKAKYFEPQHFN